MMRAARKYLSGRVGVLLAVVASLLLGWAWALASPVGASPDDDFHAASIWCPRPLESSGCQVTPDGDGDGSPDAVLIPENLRLASCYAGVPEQSAACAAELSETELAEATHVDRGLYPGTYYTIMHRMVGPDVEWTTLAIRVLNAVIATAVFAAAFLLLPRSARPMVPLAVLGASVPLGVFIIASVNPTSWGVVGVAGYFFAMHAFFLAEDRRRLLGSGVLAVVTAFMAASARSDTGAFLVVVSLAVCLLHLERIRSDWRLLALPAVASALGFYAFASSEQSGYLSASWGVDGRLGPLEVLYNNLSEVPHLILGYSGFNWPLGWFDTPMPAITYVPVIMVFGAIIAIGFRSMTLTKALSWAVAAGAYVGLPLYLLQVSLRLVGDSVQARYMLPLVPVVFAVALVARNRRVSLRPTVGQAWLIYVALVVAHTAALHTNIRRYTVGFDHLALNLSEAPEWWWPGGPGPMLVWLIGTLAFAGLALTIPASALRVPLDAAVPADDVVLIESRTSSLEATPADDAAPAPDAVHADGTTADPPRSGD